MNNPFKTGMYGGVDCFAVTVEDRVARVKKFDRAQCQAALALDDLQKSVERAIKSRLRMLDKDASTQSPNPASGMTVELEDHGQDFLEFDIRGRHIVDARPFQADVWSGAEVINETLQVGDHIEFRSEYSSGVKTLRYPIVAIRSLRPGA